MLSKCALCFSPFVRREKQPIFEEIIFDPLSKIPMDLFAVNFDFDGYQQELFQTKVFQLFDNFLAFIRNLLMPVGFQRIEF